MGTGSSPVRRVFLYSRCSGKIKSKISFCSKKHMYQYFINFTEFYPGQQWDSDPESIGNLIKSSAATPIQNTCSQISQIEIYCDP